MRKFDRHKIVLQSYSMDEFQDRSPVNSVYHDCHLRIFKLCNDDTKGGVTTKIFDLRLTQHVFIADFQIDCKDFTHVV